MCVGFLSVAAELCLLSLLLLGVGLALVGLFWCGFCASSWGTCGFPRHVLQLVTLGGFRNFLAPVSWPTPAVDVCCWVGGVLVHHLVFYLVPAQLTLSGFCNLSGSSLLAYSCGGALLLGWVCLWCVCMVLYLVPCSSSGACSLRSLTCNRFPWGFSAFSVTGCLSFCYPGGVGCQATLPFFFLCFSCSGWLAGVRWVLHPVSGCSSWGCVCSLGDSIVTLLAFPYLRVGELLDCGVYGVSYLRSLQSRLPFVVHPPFLVSVCSSPALGLGWFGHRSVAPPAAPVCWALLESRLRCCDALASGRTLSFCFLSWVFFLGRVLGLGLVGGDPAWVSLLLVGWTFGLREGSPTSG